MRARLILPIMALAAGGLTLGAVIPASAASGTPATRTAVTRMAAVASAPPADCPAGDLCGWTGNDYEGTIGRLAGFNLTLPTIPWHEAHSIYNHGVNDDAVVYRGTDYNSEGGHDARLYRCTGFPVMSSELPGLYNHVYSNKWVEPGAPSACG